MGRRTICDPGPRPIRRPLQTLPSLWHPRGGAAKKGRSKATACQNHQNQLSADWTTVILNEKSLPEDNSVRLSYNFCAQWPNNSFPVHLLYVDWHENNELFTGGIWFNFPAPLWGLQHISLKTLLWNTEKAMDSRPDNIGAVAESPFMKRIL